MREIKHLTAPFVRAAKSRSGELWGIVDAGFNARGQMVLRISPKGLKTFTFRSYNPAGLQRRYGMGHYPGLSLAKAREKALILSGRVASGEDPAEDRLRQKQAAREAMRFRELASLYLRDHAKLHKVLSSQQADKRIIEKDLLPVLGDRDIRLIARADVVKVTDAIVARGSKVMANRTRALLSTIFTFARNKGYRPVDSVNPAKMCPCQEARKRAVSVS